MFFGKFKIGMQGILFVLFVSLLLSCGTLSQPTQDKLKARTDQLVSKSADVVFDELEKVVSNIQLERLQGVTRAVLPAGMKLRQISDEGIEVTKAAEGFVARLYDDPAKYCTVGYGHLIKLSRCNGDEPSELTECKVSVPGELKKPISESRGEQILRCDMRDAEIAVMLLARQDLEQHEFDALADFVYNVGAGNFRKSTLRKYVNNGQYDRVAYEFRKWNKAGGKEWGGLKVRREKNINTFFNGQAPRGVGVPAESELIDIYTGKN